MLKSVVNKMSVEEILPFPKLMINKSKDCIILATTINGNSIIGISVGGSLFGIGEYRDDWKLNYFDDFHGSITLIQSN